MEEQVSGNIMSFWIREMISHVYRSATDEDCKAVKVKAHEAWKVGTSVLFRENFAIQQVLKPGTWSSETTASAFYLQDVTQRCMDTFSLSPTVAAQEVM